MNTHCYYTHSFCLSIYTYTHRHPYMYLHMMPYIHLAHYIIYRVLVTNLFHSMWHTTISPHGLTMVSPLTNPVWYTSSGGWGKPIHMITLSPCWCTAVLEWVALVHSLYWTAWCRECRVRIHSMCTSSCASLEPNDQWWFRQRYDINYSDQN